MHREAHGLSKTAQQAGLAAGTQFCCFPGASAILHKNIHSLEFRSCPTSHQCDLGQGLVPSVNQGHHSVSALGCCQEVVQGEGRGAPAASGPPPKCSLGLLQGLRGRHVGGIPSQVQVHPRPKAPSSDSRKMVGSPGRGGGLGVHPGYAVYGTSR